MPETLRRLLSDRLVLIAVILLVVAGSRLLDAPQGEPRTSKEVRWDVIESLSKGEPAELPIGKDHYLSVGPFFDKSGEPIDFTGVLTTGLSEAADRLAAAESEHGLDDYRAVAAREGVIVFLKFHERDQEAVALAERNLKIVLESATNTPELKLEALETVLTAYRGTDLFTLRAARDIRRQIARYAAQDPSKGVELHFALAGNLLRIKENREAGSVMRGAIALARKARIPHPFLVHLHVSLSGLAWQEGDCAEIVATTSRAVDWLLISDVPQVIRDIYARNAPPHVKKCVDDGAIGDWHQRFRALSSR